MLLQPKTLRCPARPLCRLRCTAGPGNLVGPNPSSTISESTSAQVLSSAKRSSGVGLSRDFRFGHPDTVRVLPSAARMQDLGSPLTVDAPFAPDSVAKCRFIAAFQLAGGLFADTAP